MIKMTISDVAQLFGCPVTGANVAFQGVSSDTRTLAAGNLYIALRGEQFDGHDFVEGARHKGAAAALVSRLVDTPLPQIWVADTQAALGKLSAYWRNQFTCPFIGVTGSNGKTTLKNMIAAILQAACRQNDAVLATLGNLNNAIGLPLTLLRLAAHHRYAVIEMGMNHFGEIAYLTELTKPTVAVINNAAESHLEGLKTIRGVAQAKGEIFQGLNSSGTAILNRDDDHFAYWQTLIAGRAHLTFGLKNPADISADISKAPLIVLHTPKGSIELTMPLLGLHNVMNALAATAATMAIGIDLADIKQGLEQMVPAHGRMQPHVLRNGAQIIDDTYNANPFSLTAAVDALSPFSGTKIVVLGDMKELGDDANAMHFNAGKKIRAAGIDYLFTYGNLSAHTCEGFGENAMHFEEQGPLITALKPHVQANVTILVKGSRSMKMEKVLQALVTE